MQLMFTLESPYNIVGAQKNKNRTSIAMSGPKEISFKLVLVFTKWCPQSLDRGIVTTCLFVSISNKHKIVEDDPKN